MSRARLTSQDWTLAALRALAAGGVAAVRVDVIARDLGVTRGSFYWHFADRDALLKAALELWEEQLTTQVLDELDGVGDPAARLERLTRVVFSDERVPGLQPAIMAHADHPVVRPVLRRVTARRVDYLTGIYAELGLEPPAARRRAVIAYAMYLGWLDLRRGPGDVVTEVGPGPHGAAAVDAVVTMLLGGLAG